MNSIFARHKCCCLPVLVFLVGLVNLVGCGSGEPRPSAWNEDGIPATAETTSVELEKRDLVFLTREGCVNTPQLRASLDAALATSGVSPDYLVVDQGALPSTDERCGYPTPTILLDGHDLFGLLPPLPPFPEPS